MTYIGPTTFEIVGALLILVGLILAWRWKGGEE